MGKGKGKKGAAQLPSPAVAPDEAYLDAVTEKRILFFEQIKDRQAHERAEIGGGPIRITLSDGAVKEDKKWMSTPWDIAREIKCSSCLIAQVNGRLWDMTRPLEEDCELKLLVFDSKEGRDTLWHSSAHILGQALESVYGCKLCSIWPCTTTTEGQGF